ncbi:MAG: hypothetical protein ACRD6X_13635 [Pyrinomonadaceae bacterium]
MSLIEVIEAIQELSPHDKAKVREVLEDPDQDSRVVRFRRLSGSLKDERFESLTLEDFIAERREIWKGLAS